MSYTLALVFLLGGLGLTALGIYFYRKLKEAEAEKRR
ncbi:hypothetical protein Saut_0360 [Sulfurimonas autotrophica DSM 16294]|uniref:Uncharacterized protein n=1 Tax=Sulfurimonas autotrophica (strain ATCC BAA-671 / DSM 16294 / JCM 11897 / OK10) TaxID=563040 RepID=E0UUH3_SULAO|nr:hypothetical protein Saut_0360 [Sulfurimonas autotrophica DSM 16294]